MIREALPLAGARPARPLPRLGIRAYRRLTAATAVATWILIVLGGIVRATESGLGCATWPMCDGSLLPKLEYHQLIEWNHRFFATLVGLLMIATVGATLLWFRRPRRLLWLALLAAVTYIVQAILGGITVLLKLPQTWIAAHMGNSMLLLAALILLALFAYLGPVGVGESDRRLRRLALGTTLWTYAAMFTGSAVVGAKADLACPAWPFCADTNLLPVTFDQWINFGHRISVAFSDILMLLLAVAIWRTRQGNRRLMLSTHILAVFYVGQVLLGAVTIWTGAPPVMKSAHLALAAAVWGALVLMTAFVWIGAPDAAPGAGPGEPAPRRARRPRPAPLVTQARTQYRVLETAQAYATLMKPRIIPLLLVPTVAAILMAAMIHPPAQPLPWLIVWTMLGGILAAGGAHALNHYLDRDLDSRMRRTRNRPVVTGRIRPRRALAFGVVLSVLAFGQLWLTTNLTAALLAIAGNLFYVFIYTIWLKRTSTQNIVIGGAAGAVPPLVGWAAVTGDIGVPALLFFTIIFFWTPPHFWALALVRQEDYRAAGIPMLPVVRGAYNTRVQILVYSVLLLAVSLLLFATNALGLIYLAAATALGAMFVLRAGQLLGDGSVPRAWRLFKFSNIYLALLYLVMVVDRLVAFAGISVLLWGLLMIVLAAGVALIVMGLACAGWIGELRHGT
jgi:protoheme IX farnesyltransferase